MTMVTITIKLPVEGNDTATNPQIRSALEALADIMLVQAEDGLYTFGSPDASDQWNESGTEIEVPNEYLRGIGSGQSVTVEIEPFFREPGRPVTIHYSHGRSHLVTLGDVSDDDSYTVLLDDAVAAIKTTRDNVAEWQFSSVESGRITVALFTKEA